MINANGLQANVLSGILDTPANTFDVGGGIDTSVINEKFGDAVKAAKDTISSNVDEAKAKIEEAAAKAKANITQAKNTATANGTGSAPTEIDSSYTHPVAVIAGLAAGAGTAMAVYHAREKHNKNGIFVPALCGVLVDSIVHFSTSQIIQNTR